MPLIEIEKYEVMYSANTFFPRLWLKNAGEYIGQLIFYPNGQQLPSDNTTNNQIQLYYHLDDYPNAIDLLRGEGPLYILFNGSGAENGLRTFDETVGENEIQPQLP